MLQRTLMSALPRTHLLVGTTCKHLRTRQFRYLCHGGLNNPATVLDQPEKSFTAPSQISVLLTHHSTIVESAKLPYASWRGSASSLEIKQPERTPDRAYRARQDVIGYCKRQPHGYLEVDEGVRLGTLGRRLRHYCG
jgi:hypothetical protein